MTSYIQPWVEQDIVHCHQVAVAASGVLAWPLTAYETGFRAGHLGFVAKGGFIGSSVIGCVIGQVVVDDAELHDIQVMPSFQGGGTGLSLLNAFVVKCQSLGAVRVILEVRESNAKAIAFYCKHGFAQIGQRKGYYPAQKSRSHHKKQEAEDAFILALNLA